MKRQLTARCGLRQHLTTGFTLTELMIGIALGSSVLVMALQALAQGRAAAQTSENIAALEERAAFALTALEQDVLLAGYWGTHADVSLLTVAAHVSIHCRGADITATALTSTAVSASDGTYDLPCPAASSHISGTDTLIVRHADPVVTEAEAGRVQLCTTALAGEIFQNGIRPAACPADQPLHNVQIHGWYINTASSEFNLPALHRYTLTAGGLLQNQEVMPGVEDFQVTLGVDRDADGQIDGFVDPGSAPSAPVLAIRLWLLLRTARAEAGHVDNGPWYSIDADRTAPLSPADHYRRTSIERTIWLRNASGV
jgi:prepilin-type N-terminal cleavage/methylation domain-containing protein